MSKVITDKASSLMSEAVWTLADDKEDEALDLLRCSTAVLHVDMSEGRAVVLTVLTLGQIVKASLPPEAVRMHFDAQHDTAGPEERKVLDWVYRLLCIDDVTDPESDEIASLFGEVESRQDCESRAMCMFATAAWAAKMRRQYAEELMRRRAEGTDPVSQAVRQGMEAAEEGTTMPVTFSGFVKTDEATGD